MNLFATQDNIVLRPIMASDKSAGGIVLPGERNFEDGCVVLSIGPNVEDIAVGDIVVRPDPPRYTISDDDTGEVLMLCAEVDILAKILPEKLPRSLTHPPYGTIPLLSEIDDVTDETEKTEAKEEVEGGEEGQVHTDRLPETRLGRLLPLRPAEGLSEDDGDEGVG